MSRTVQVDWGPLREMLPGRWGVPRGTCESCGLYLWSDGAYKIPGLAGRYCSIQCVEFELAQRSSCHWCFDDSGEPAGTKRRYCNDACRKQAQSVPLGDGTRLLRFLERRHPSLYSKVIENAQAAVSVSTCLECRAPLNGKRVDSAFCSRVHLMRYRRRLRDSSTGPNGGIIGNTPIGSKGLNEGQNAGMRNTLTGQEAHA